MAPASETGPADGLPVVSCEHDGKASGRLVLERGGIRREIVCDCGEVLAVLGHQTYHFNRASVHARHAARDGWRRSRELLFSFGARHRHARSAAGARRIARRA